MTNKIKERSFYVINLDNKRLLMVGVSLIVIMASVMAAGYRMGAKELKKKKGAQNNYLAMDNLTVKENPLEKKNQTGSEQELATKTIDSGKQYETIDLSSPTTITKSSSESASNYNSQNSPSYLSKASNNSYNSSETNSTGKTKISQKNGSDKSTSWQKSKNDPNGDFKSKGFVSSKKSSKSYYTIQIAAFKKFNRAAVAQEKLKKKNISSKIVKGNKFYFVRKGKSQYKDNLKKAISRIKKKTNYYPIIIKTQT
jgi:cell division septation protein DedD